MVEKVENLLLGRMMRLQATLERIERKQDDLIGRLTNLERLMRVLN